ncbi:MAG: hypothetical protein H2174_05420 [Vampirovibrio sp.]|jgi:hypothetical protein|nr:hypothetical protein [Vampirovibrio sp.]
MIATTSISMVQPSVVFSVTLRSGIEELGSETSLRYYKMLITPPPQKRFLTLEETARLKGAKKHPLVNAPSGIGGVI